MVAGVVSCSLLQCDTSREVRAVSLQQPQSSEQSQPEEDAPEYYCLQPYFRQPVAARRIELLQGRAVQRDRPEAEVSDPSAADRELEQCGGPILQTAEHTLIRHRIAALAVDRAQLAGRCESLE